MQRCVRRRSGNRLLLLVCLALVGAAIQSASPRQGGFDKQGRFIAPDIGISLATVHQKAPSYDGPQPFDVLHYDLDVYLPLTTHELSGRNTIIMRLKEAVDSLDLHGVGLSLDTVRVDGVLKTTTLKPASEMFTVHLDTTRYAGDTLRMVIDYRRIPEYPRPSSRQGYYFFRDTLGIPSNLGYTFSEPSDARFWMPCYDEPWDKATAEIRVTVPQGYVPASNGLLQSVTINGNGTETWHWVENNQIATYLMCITASVFTVSEIPYVSVTGDTIPLQYYAWPSDSASVAAYLPSVAAMMYELESMFGPYPFDKYGMTAIVPFVFLGMEHQTITTMNRFYRTDNRVVVHELGHQWWGNLVTCGTWPDIWLNEGFATYTEALWRERTGGPAALRGYMVDSLSHFNNATWQGAIYNPVAQGFNLFAQSVYSKGAWVLHTLRGVVGDTIFFAILRAYRERYEGRSAVTAELEAVVDSVVGQDMGWFFDQWVYGRGWPHYRYTHDVVGDTIVLQIAQTQDALWPTFRMPVQLRLQYDGTPDTTIVVLNDQRLQSYSIPLAGTLLQIDFDPHQWILKQVFPWPLSVSQTGAPLTFTLEQNYPNPFNPTTTIQFAIPVGTYNYTSLRVYDVLGREVATLVNDELNPGTYEVTWDASGQASGVYYYRLQTGGFTETKRLVLLH
jgi:aminopeptidase N